MPLPILPLLLAGGAAIAAIAMGSKKDGSAPGGGGAAAAPGAPVTNPTAPLPHGPNNPFDNGLTAQQVVAIQTALASETDPDKLDAFARSLLPDFPIAAAALTSRAITIRVAAAANAPPPPAPPMPIPPAGVIFPPTPALPTTVFVPPVVPAVFGATWPQSGTITTNDTGASGDLLVRATPDANGAPIGSHAHGATVTVTGPAQNGFYPLADGGFSSAQYITLKGAAPFAVPVIAPSGGFPQSATVITNDTGPSGDLLVRATPSSSGAQVGKNAHGATVLVTGPAISGFYPVAGTGGVGFSSSQYLRLDGPVQMPTVPGLPASPFGGLVQPASFVVPSTPPFPQVGSQAIIATADTGPSGALNLRASAPSGAVIGSNPHGATVTITGPQTSGFYPITGPGGSGFSSASYLAAAPAATVSAGATGLGQAGAKVQVTANLLGLRGSPDARAPYIAQASKGSTFTIAGPAVGNYYPLRDDAGAVAWASALFLAGVQNVAAGFADTGAGPSIPFAELQSAALALKTALAVHGCRSYNEPLVKDFQRVAKLAGIYTGDIDGWYGTVTQAALSKIVGKPAPACFANPTGGPNNPNEYWSPMGV